MLIVRMEYSTERHFLGSMPGYTLPSFGIPVLDVAIVGSCDESDGMVNRHFLHCGVETLDSHRIEAVGKSMCRQELRQVGTCAGI